MFSSSVRFGSACKVAIFSSLSRLSEKLTIFLHCSVPHVDYYRIVSGFHSTA